MRPRQELPTDTGIARGERRTTHALTLVALLAFAAAAPVHAQPAEVHTFARPGRPLMTLYVLGSVNKPGIWQVEREATLVEVLTLISPNTATGDRKEGREEHILKLYRGDAPPPDAPAITVPIASAAGAAGPDPTRDGSRTLVFEATVHEVLSGQRQPPHLRHGDVLTVETTTHKPWLTLQSVTTTVGAVSAFVLLLLRLGDL